MMSPALSRCLLLAGEGVLLGSRRCWIVAAQQISPPFVFSFSPPSLLEAERMTCCPPSCGPSLPSTGWDGSAVNAEPCVVPADLQVLWEVAEAGFIGQVGIRKLLY